MGEMNEIRSWNHGGDIPRPLLSAPEPDQGSEALILNRTIADGLADMRAGQLVENAAALEKIRGWGAKVEAGHSDG